MTVAMTPYLTTMLVNQSVIVNCKTFAGRPEKWGGPPLFLGSNNMSRKLSDFANKYLDENSEDGLCAKWCKLYLYNNFSKNQADVIWLVLPMDTAIDMFLDMLDSNPGCKEMH